MKGRPDAPPPNPRPDDRGDMRLIDTSAHANRWAKRHPGEKAFLALGMLAVVLAAPLVFYQLLTFLETRMLHLPPAWNPSYTLLPFEAYFQGFTLAQMGLHFALLLAGSMACLRLFARRANTLQ